MQLNTARTARSKSNNKKFFEDLALYEQQRLNNLEAINDQMTIENTHKPK